MKEAFVIAEEQENTEKWKKVGDVALVQGNFKLAEECFSKSKDYNSQLLFYSSCGDAEGMEKLLEDAESNGKYNVAFEAAYLLGEAQRCTKILIKSKRIGEAVLFARSHCPSMMAEVLKEWDQTLKQKELPF